MKKIIDAAIEEIATARLEARREALREAAAYVEKVFQTHSLLVLPKRLLKAGDFTVEDPRGALDRPLFGTKDRPMKTVETLAEEIRNLP